MSVQPSLPSLELPEFEGITPVGVVTRLTGASQRITRAIHHGDKVILLVEAELADIGHPKTKDGVKRHQKLTVVDLYELDGATGKPLLVSVRESYREADDARLGRQPLPVDGPSGVVGLTDDHGHPLDADDLAEIRGDPAVARADREAADELEAARGRVVGEPWPGYEQSGAREIVGHVKQLDSAEEAFAVAAWEEGHGARPSVVKAAHARAAELAGGAE